MLFSKFRNFIMKHSMLKPGNAVIVSLSGGPDSTALLLLLSRLTEFHLRIIGGHVNHRLRGDESDKDEAFIRDMCGKVGVPIFVRGVDTRPSFQESEARSHESLQSFARNIRYSFLQELSEKEGAQKIALGHNMDDQAETILFRILRGCGIEGISGMKPARGKIIRPLLGISKSEIVTFLDASGFTYRTDSSNKSKKYLRNKIRLELLPTLKQYNPQIKTSLSSLADVCREENDFMEQETLKIFETATKTKHSIEFDAVSLRTLQHNGSAVLVSRVIKKSIYALSVNPDNISKKHIDSVVELLSKDNGFKFIMLPENTVAAKDGEKLRFYKKHNDSRETYIGRWDIAPEGVTVITKYGIKIHTRVLKKEEIEPLRRDGGWDVLDFESLSFPLCVRFRKPGDRFHPLGMPVAIKLKDFFIKQKIPRAEREKQLLLKDKDGIICVLGLRIQDKCRLTSSTKKIFAVKIEQRAFFTQKTSFFE